jgi:hypothetical protein
MTTVRVGVQLQPQATGVDELRQAWRAADEIGRYVDAGASHVIVMVGSPFDLSSVESLIAQRDALS